MKDNTLPEFSDKTFSWRDGKRWFDSGINYFKQVKNYWYLNCLWLAVVVTLLSNIALELVSIVVIFASPVITAFIMHACDKAAKNQMTSFVICWQLTMKYFQPLMLLGLLSAVFSVISYYVHIQLLHVFNLPVELTESMASQMSGKEAILRAVLNIVTNLPIAMALAFSPALILFKQSKPLLAIKFSVLAVLKAWRSFVILMLLFIMVFIGIVVLASLIVAVVMAVMGPSSQFLTGAIIMFFVVTVAGIGLCAQYQAFTEIFWDNSDEIESDQVEIYTEI